MFLSLSHTVYLFLVTYSFSETSALKWRVFGGQDIRYDAHKYLVKLQLYGHDEDLDGICSGSIINSNWVLTAAHCVPPDIHKVIVQHRTKEKVKIIAEVYDRDIHAHPDFIPDIETGINIEKDVALLYIKNPIKFDSSIDFAKLATNNPRVGEIGIIAGHGQSEDGFSKPKEGAAMIARCPYYSGNLICAKGLVRAGDGDSGGPLMYKGKLVAVTSRGCEDVYEKKVCFTVFASVAANIDWIRKVTKEVDTRGKSKDSY